MDFQDDEIKEILNIFRVEADEIIERLNTALLELEKNPQNKDLIVLLFRDAHSLKGASRMVGFKTIQNLAHKMEDILGYAKDNKLVLTSEIADIMYKSVDLISKIITQSIQNGKEIYGIAEVENQLKVLEHINPENEEIKIFQPDIQEEIAPEVVEVENSQTSSNAVGFSRVELVKSVDRVNFLIINSLILVIKLTEKIEKDFINKLLENIDELVEIFNKINYFEIKNILATIQLKLNVIVKCDGDLTVEEVEEIQQEIDRIIKEFTTLSEINELQTVDYYGYAFEEKDYVKGTSQVDTSEKIVEPEVIEEVKSVTKFLDFENITKKLHTLEISNEYIAELISAFTEFKNSYQQAEFVPVLSRIIELLDFVNKNNIKIDEASLEILLNSAQYCFALVNNEQPSGNIELLSQQLTVAKQLLEISSVPAQNVSAEINIPKNIEVNTQSNKMKDFSKLFDTGEIKTLHVDSSKLDFMVNQIGELISTKIKTSKQLSELSNSEKLLEEWQKDFSKFLQHMKMYEKKLSKPEKELDNSSSIFMKQFLNTLSEQNKKLNGIVSTISKLQRSNLEEDAKLKNLITDFDSIVKNIRVLPLATVFHMFGRMVRDIAKESGKEVELTISGSETSADKKIIEEIKNPLIHIIRNSIDHGIETPEKRKEKGKSPVGHLNINAKNLDNKIVIEIIDDGQGFNIEKIKEKALKNGILMQEELNSLSEEDIINLVFLPGFTTGDEVTSISGRGIGMDVVKSKIAQLNGSVKVISEFNKGSCIQIELPVTMATMKVFLIQSSGQNFAVPMSVINTVVCKKNEEILNNNGKFTIIHNNKNIPVYSLADILGLKDNVVTTMLKTIIIVEANNKTIGLVVDKLIGEQEILHKKLSPPIYKLKNISGITTLASGETCLILNTSDIIKNTTFQKISSINNSLIQDKKLLNSDKKILIVDDSITSRTLEKNILMYAGFAVLSAINPIEALKILNQTKVDLIITDIEMPEMNGLDFIEQLKSNSATSEIPVIVMSSLLDDKTKRKIKSLNIEKFLIKGEFNQKLFLKVISENL